MFFSEEFIRSIEESPISGIVEACELVMKKLETYLNKEWDEEAHELLWESASFLKLVIEINNLHVDFILPKVSREISKNCDNLQEYIKAIYSFFKDQSFRLKIDSYKDLYQTAFKASFAYEFSQGDFERIQTLVNELRNHISENDDLDVSHKQRLLKRLESLQSELHKRVSDLDRFWGIVGDAGVVAGKLGTDAKPIVDRVKEIAEIVWKTQARTEELPSDSLNPMLGHDENT